MPHDLYMSITQSLARLSPGPPVRRGPIESKSVCDSFWTCELSMPSRQMRWSVGVVGGELRRPLRRGRRGERDGRECGA